jgi:hypothetical protein
MFLALREKNVERVRVWLVAFGGAGGRESSSSIMRGTGLSAPGENWPPGVDGHDSVRVARTDPRRQDPPCPRLPS